MRTLCLILLLAAGPLGAAAPAPTPVALSPTGLSGELRLSWAAIPPAGSVTGYQVYFDTSPGLGGASPVYVTSLSFTQGGLVDGARYWAAVAGDAGGTQSLTLSAVPFAPIDAPALSATAQDYGAGIYLQWSTPATHGYSIGAYRVEQVLGGGTVTVRTLGAGLSGTTLSLPCSSVLTLQVRAVDVLGNTGFPSATSQASYPCAPLATPLSLSAGSLKLAWAVALTVNPITQYQLRYASSPGLPDPLPTLDFSTPNSLSFSAQVPLGQSRYFRVYAQEAGGLLSAGSNELAVLAPPLGLTATARQGRVLLDWARPGVSRAIGVTSYQVYYATYAPPVQGAPGTSEVIFADPGQNSPTVHVTVTALSDGIPLYFAVASEGGALAPHLGGLGLTVSATPYLPAPFITSFNQVQAGNVTLTWATSDISPNVAAAYNVYAATDSFLSTKSLQVTASASTFSASFPAPAFPNAYWFVQAVDISGNASSFTPTSGVLFAPMLQSPSLAVSLTGNTRVFLSWTADANATEFQIYRATQGVTGTAAAYVTQSAWVNLGSSFIDTRPVNGQLNLYKVLARHRLGLSLPSQTESALSLSVGAMPEVAPGLPGTFKSGAVTLGAYLTATVRSNLGYVDLSWAPAVMGSRSISYYRVFQGYNGGSLAPLSTVSAPLNSLAHANLDPGAQVYGVEAVDVSGTVGPRLTGAAKAYTAWQAPQTPTALVLATGVRLAWSPAPSLGAGSYPLTAYRVFRVDQAGSADAFVADVSGTAYLDSVPAALRGPQLSYAIGSLDSAGLLGGLTRVAAPFGPAVYTGVTPSAPLSVTARTLTGTAVPVLIQWEPNPEAEGVTSSAGYAVYRDASPSALAVLTSTSFVDNGPSIGGSHSYSVQAVNAAGPGLSSTAAPSPLFIAPPQPSFLAISQTVDTLGDTTLAYVLYWQDLGAPGNVDGYNVYRGGTQIANGITAFSFSDTVTAASGIYVSYTVSAVVGGAESGSPAFLALTVTAPAAPAAFTATSKNGTINLDWTPQNGAKLYWLYRSSTGMPLTPTAVEFYKAVSASSFSDVGVNASFTWIYAVAALNEMGRGAASSLTVVPQPGLATNLSATAGYGSSPQITLTWTEPFGNLSAASYEIWRGTDAALMSLLSSTAAPASSYVDAPVGAGTPYYYQVRSFNLDYAQGYSTLGPFSAYNPPAAPSGLRAAGGPLRLDLAWAPPALPQSVTGYVLSVEALDGSAGYNLPLPAEPSAVALTGLAAAYSYSLSLTAKGSGGASALAYLSATTNAAGPATVPNGFSVKAGFYDSLKLYLTWSPVGSGKNALLYRDTAPISPASAAGGPASPLYLSSLAGSASSLTDAAVTASQPYYYALTALGPDGLPGGESLPVIEGPVAPFLYPSAVQLTVTAGLGRVDLQWSPPPASQRGTAGLPVPPQYAVYRYQNSGTISAFGGTPDAGFPLRTTATVFTDTSVTNNVSYQYFVTLFDQAGREQDAGEGRLLIQPRGIPETPNAPLLVPGDASMALRWLAQKSDTQLGLKFNVYRRAAGEDYYAPVAKLFQVGPSSTTEYQGTVAMLVLTLRDTGDSVPPGGSSGTLTNTAQYCYAISQVNEYGEGGKSPEVCGTPYQPLKPASLQLNLLVQKEKDVYLSWDPAMSAGVGSYPLDGFRVYRSLDGGSTYDLLADLTATTAAGYSDKATIFGAAYVYRVLPYDDHGHEGYSYNLANVVIPASQNALLLFRNSFNPAAGETLTVQYSLLQPGHAWVRVYTLQGEFVASLFDEDVSQASADAPFLSQKKDWDGRNAAGQTVASGVYLLHLEAPGYRSNARVAVIK